MVTSLPVRQMRALPMYPSGAHRTVPVVLELADKLAALAPIPNARVAFATTGSEANDNLIKFMWYGNGHTGRKARRKIISRTGSYHGSTIFTSGLGGSTALRESFGLPVEDMIHVSQPAWPMAAEEGETEAGYTARLVRELREAIEAAGPETIGAMIAEPMSVSAGMLPPPAGYFAAVKAVLDDYGIALFADEVVTGFGRTGNMWGSQTYDLKPDMISCAKALSAGMQPISATLINQRVFDAMLDESRKLGNFAHGFTYAGHPVTTAVAMETLRIYDEMDMIGHVQQVGPYMQEALGRLIDHPLVGEVRGVGMIVGIELVADKATRALFDPKRKVGAMVDKYAREHGLICRLIGDRVAFSPPLIITESEVDRVAERLRRALDDTLAEIRGH